MNINKQEYPLNVLEEISSLLKNFYVLEYQYSDIVEMIFDNPSLVQVNDKNNNFYFILSINKTVEGNYQYQVDKKPMHALHVGGMSFGSVDYTIVNEFFIEWIDLVKKYNEILLSKDDIFMKQAEKEFYEELEIPEDNLDIKALSIDSQIKVYQLLEQMQLKLLQQSESTPAVKEIINEVEALKSSIQDMPQSVAGKKVAKLFSKIKRLGIKILLDVVDVSYKEAIKLALHGGVDAIHNHLH